MGKLPNYITVDEMSLLCDAPAKDNLRDILILRFLCGSGLRVSELVVLTWGDINFDGRMLTVRGGKGGKDRVVPFDHTTLRYLVSFCPDGDMPIDDFIFLSNRDASLSSRQIERLVKRYARAVGIKRNVYPHLLRHSFAVACLKSGMNLRTVQKMLGHSSLTTTQIYLDVTGLDVQEDYDKHTISL